MEALHLEALRDTFPSRRKWILKERPVVNDIIQRYPRLGDSKEALEQEFVLMNGVLPKLASRIEDVSTGVLRYAHAKKILTVSQILEKPCPNEGDSVCALLNALEALLPNKRGKKSEDVPSGSGNMIKSFPFASPEDALLAAKFISPGIFLAGSKYFVVADKATFSVPEGTLVAALETLIVVAYVFNLEFLPSMKFAMNFLERLLGIKEAMHCPKVIELLKDVLFHMNSSKD